MIEYLFKKACERCEEHATNINCECMLQCPVYGLYVEAKKKKKEVIYKLNNWDVPPPPKPDII